MSYSDLLKRLDSLEQEQETQEKEVYTLAEEMKPLGIDVHAYVDDIDVPKKSTKGYVILLDFGQGSPVSEWSDDTNGWRTKGLGSRYPEPAQAKRRFHELKTKWPEYPLRLSR
ncbi:hypothetical protein [Candidatus Albibeggiatoa sp. nov. NOAA]|uniref:hypothetical protein n=1 Tax=Candidatus Albibeggiatoa sp. nov. NOAA TaxID=3162724 RepID=UPI0032F8EBC6|nr:hypothetical protein [Thiotrichaceae bacterium]